jgi:NAD(P)-dependent dehydrogenase (short-subunit alcohol dehydrogenase family)
MKLAGKVAVVTGAASGMGRAVAETFAREGARVVVADLNAEGGAETVGRIAAGGGVARFVATNVGHAADVAQMVRAAEDTFGPVDVLYSNAGHGGGQAVHETAEADWDAVFDVNLKGVYLCARAVLPAMMERRTGAIVNVASTLGLAASVGRAAYCASKAGVVNLTRQMALDYAPYGIRVNCIAPGPIHTPMIEASFRRAADPERDRRRVVANIPLGRLGQPEEIAKAALFLAGDDASFITGVVLPVDGGNAARRG